VPTQVARNSRTTPKKKRGRESVDVLGETFRLNSSPNAFLGLQVTADPEDTASLYFFLINLIHEDDQRDFKNHMARQAHLSGEDLGKIITDVLQAVADPNPTGTSSGSSRSAARTGGKALSVGS